MNHVLSLEVGGMKSGLGVALQGLVGLLNCQDLMAPEC